MSGRTLAIHSGALGDLLLFGRLLEHLPAPVTLVAGGEKACLLAGLRVVDRALSFDSLPMHEIFSHSDDAPPRLPGLLGECERLVSCFAAGDRRAEMRLIALTGASSAAFLPIRPDPDFTGHLAEMWADLLGLAIDVPHSRAWIAPPQWREAARERLARTDINGPFVAIHPGAGAEDKCWPLDGFLTCARLLAAQGTPPVFLAGPVEADRWSGDGRLERISREFPLLADLPLAHLAGLLAEASGALGNDSGTSHLAGALGTPTAAIFITTRADHFRPLGPRVVTLAAGDKDTLTPGRVVEAIRRWTDDDSGLADR